MPSTHSVSTTPIKLRSFTDPFPHNSRHINDTMELSQTIPEPPISINTELTKNNINKITSDLQTIKSNLDSLNSQREKLSSSSRTHNPDFSKSFKTKSRRLDAKVKEINEALLSGNYILSHLKSVGIPEGIIDKDYSRQLLKLRNTSSSQFDSPQMVQREILRILRLDTSKPVSSDSFPSSSVGDPSEEASSIIIIDRQGSPSSNSRDRTSSLQQGLTTNSSLSSQQKYDSIVIPDIPTITPLSDTNINNNHHDNSHQRTNSLPKSPNSILPMMKISSECENYLELLGQLLPPDILTSGGYANSTPGVYGHSNSSSSVILAPVCAGGKSTTMTTTASSTPITTEQQQQQPASHRSQFINHFKTGFESIKRRTIDNFDTSRAKKKSVSSSLENVGKATLKNTTVNNYDTSCISNPNDETSYFSREQSPNSSEKLDNSKRSNRSITGLTPIKSPTATMASGRENAARSCSSQPQHCGQSSDSNFPHQMTNVDETMSRLWKLCGVSPRSCQPAATTSTKGRNQVGPNIPGSTSKSNRSHESNSPHVTLDAITVGNNNCTSASSNGIEPTTSCGGPTFQVDSDLNPVKLAQAFTIIYHMVSNCMQQVSAQASMNQDLQEKLTVLSNDIGAYSTIISHLKYDLNKLRDDFDMKIKLNGENFNNILTRIELLSASAEGTRQELKSDNQSLKEEFNRTSEKLNYQLVIKTRDLSDVIQNIQNKFPILEQRFEQLTISSNETSPSRLILMKLAEFSIGVIVLVNTIFQLIIRTLNTGATLTDNRIVCFIINFAVLFLILTTLFKDYLPSQEYLALKINSTMKSVSG